MRFVEDTTDSLPYGFIKGGYFNYSSWSFVLITIMNAGLSFFFLLVGLPLIIAIALIIKVTDRGPIFYKGVRLGLSKNPFNMFKFRTLPVGSQKVIGKETLSAKHAGAVAIPTFSRFLRDTRLDELPQLFNILRGEMDFIGPRPIRPEIYEAQAAQITGFDARFSVRPGLIGYSQLFTPHSAPKRLRSLIDNRFVRRRRSIIWDMIIITYTILVVARDVVTKGTKLIWRDGIKRRLLRMYIELRIMERIRTPGMTIHLDSPQAAQANPELYDINEFYFRMHATGELNGETYPFTIEAQVRKQDSIKPKRFKGLATVYKSIPIPVGEGRHCYIMQFEPTTPLNKYILDQYILRRSIIRG